MNLVQKLNYTILNAFNRLAFRVYFRKITVRGRERIPKDCPTIVATNHPNTMSDPLLMANIMPGWIQFMANYSLFKHPVMAFLMGKVFFCVPVKRPKDVAPGEAVDNTETLDRCCESLVRGGTIFMGPEGTSYAYRRIRPMKKGVAWMALGVAERMDFRSNLVIMPIGTNYEAVDGFRSEIIIQAGEPIAVDAYRVLYEQDKKAAVNVIMSELRRQLEALTLHTQDEVSGVLLEGLGDVAASEGLHRNFQEKLDWSQQALLKIDALRQTPTLFVPLWHAMRDYLMALSRQSTTDAAVRRLEHEKTHKGHFRCLKPLYYLGCVLNFYWFIPNWLAKKAKVYRSYVSMVSILVGAVLIPLFFTLVTALVGMLLGKIWALAYTLCVAILAVFVMWYRRERERFVAHRNARAGGTALLERRSLLVGRCRESGLL